MKLPATVYAIRNEVTRKIYVGRSANPKRRLQYHMSLLRRGEHPVADMQADFDDYGEHFRFFILDKIEKYADRGKELDWQKRLNTLDRRYGYNYQDSVVTWYNRGKTKHT